jgi:hypothetical protein
MGDYNLWARLNLAASCTGSSNQLLSLPVAGTDLTMEFAGGPGKCLDVAMAGTSAPTNAGVSGVRNMQGFLGVLCWKCRHAAHVSVH